ncbi:hypothetical protein TWF506_005860 [Arthrobotrys conoides]|uniref:WW domain-containing protein n=1 Tax=Arthrobotrys conoides TaxID=74498 RepID=A0AAN8NXD3_9PEZI
MYNRGLTTSSPYLFPAPTPWHTAIPPPPPQVDRRPLPPGWTQSYDRSTNRYFYTDTNILPFKSFWSHPGDCGYDPGIYGRRFTYDEVLAARRRGYRISHGIEWLRNLRAPREVRLGCRWREPRYESEDEDEKEEEEEREYRRRKRREFEERKKTRSQPRVRGRYRSSRDEGRARSHSLPRSVRGHSMSERGYYSGESAAEGSGTQRVYSSERASSSSGTSDSRTLADYETSRSAPSTSEVPEQPSNQPPAPPSQDQDVTPIQIPQQTIPPAPRERPTIPPPEPIPTRPSSNPPEQPPQATDPTTTPQPPGLQSRGPPLEQSNQTPERVYAASDLDFPTIPQGGIYLIPHVVNPWLPALAEAPLPPPPPPPPYSSPDGSTIGRSRASPAQRMRMDPDSVELGFRPSDNNNDNHNNNNNDQQQQSTGETERNNANDMTFYLNLNRGENLGHRGTVSPRAPPASPVRIGSARIMRSTGGVPDQPSSCNNNQTTHSTDEDESEFTENPEFPEDPEPESPSEHQDEIELPQEPPTLIDRFRKVLHLHVPTPAEKSAKREFKKAKRATKEAETASRNQRRYQAAADRMRKQSDLLNEMNRRESAIYHSQALKDKLGFDEEVFRKKIIEGTLMSKSESSASTSNNTGPSSAPSEPSGSDASLPNPVVQAAASLDTSMPGNLQPSPNAPIGVTTDPDSATRRTTNPEEPINPNKLRTPAPSPPRFYGEAPQMVPDTLYRRHAHDLSRARGREPYLRMNWARHGEETDPRYGAFGSGRFGAGSPAAVRWQMDHRGFRRPPNRPSVFGGDTRRHPQYFDYAEYDEHEWDGGGGYHGSSLNCGW